MTEIQDHSGERIAKIIARAGLCSRRDAEAWISAGRVAVNGKVLDSPAFNVKTEDAVTVDGAPLAQRERTRLFFFHKPRGSVTTDFDPEGRTTIFDILPPDLPRVVTVGRLDINTEGLLLLTNDGGLARALELPATGWLRRYRVRAHGRTDQARLDELGKGLTIDGVNYRSIEARLDREQGANVWLTIGLREGKNREVKKVLEHIGLDVNRLIRVSFGPFQLGELEEGAVEEVKTRILKDQLGDKITQLANADFDAPLFEAAPDGSRREVREPGLRRDDHAPVVARPVRAADPRSRGRDDNRPGEPVEPPRETPKDGKRRHVSASRDMARARAGDMSERRRIEKDQTADRRGRFVPVERVVTAARRGEPGEANRSSNGDAPIRRSTRNARNFADLARGANDDSPQQRRGSDSKNETRERPRNPRSNFRSENRGNPREADGGRPAHRSDSHSGGRQERPARASGPDRSGSGGGFKKDRFAGGKGPAEKFRRPERGHDTPRTSRAQFADPVIPERTPWGEPQRDDAAVDRPKRGDRPDRGGSRERSHGDRAHGDRPRGERSYARGKSGADRAGGGKFSNDRPSFGGPRGGKPSFSKSAGDRKGPRDRNFGERGEGRAFDAPKTRGGSPPRGAGGGGRPSYSGRDGGRPGGGKPGGRPAGGGRPGGGRPAGGRPAGGGRPGRGRPGGGGSGGRGPR